MTTPLFVSFMKNIPFTSDHQYLTPSASDKKYGITVNYIGFQKFNPNNDSPNKRYNKNPSVSEHSNRKPDEFQFIYITKGGGEITLNQQEHTIIQGHLIVLFPGESYSYQPDNLTGWSEYSIGFNGSTIENLVKNSFLTTSRQILNVGLNEELVSLFQQAINAARQDKNGLQLHLSGILMHIIGLVLYQSTNSNSEHRNYEQLIEKAKIIINENTLSGIRAKEVADKSGITYNNFRR